MQDFTSTFGNSAAEAAPVERAAFIRRTYTLLALAILASILYETSNVLHCFNTRQHVAASLTLFASIALLFWYILSIFSSRD